jgi:hypothetical protein
MARLILFSGVTGAALLLLATGLLVHLNWSAKIYGPVFSILLLGIATTLATVFTLLKESRIESAITTEVMIDSQDGAPPIFVMENPENSRLSERYSELGMLGHPAVKNPAGGAAIITSRVNSESEPFAFGGELLQYYILKMVEKFQRGGSKFGFIGGTADSSVNLPLKVSRLEDHPGSDFLGIIAANRFSNSDREQSLWQHGHMPLPEGAGLSLPHEKPPAGGGAEKYIVRIQKPLFFEVDIAVSPLGGINAGMPKGIQLDPAVAARCTTYFYQVTMSATFYKITAGNWQTEEYKHWVSQLFEKLADNLRD